MAQVLGGFAAGDLVCTAACAVACWPCSGRVECRSVLSVCWCGVGGEYQGWRGGLCVTHQGAKCVCSLMDAARWRPSNEPRFFWSSTTLLPSPLNQPPPNTYASSKGGVLSEPSFFFRTLPSRAHTSSHMSGHHLATVRRAGRKRGARFERSEALAEQPPVARSAVELHRLG